MNKPKDTEKELAQFNGELDELLPHVFEALEIIVESHRSLEELDDLKSLGL